jgi:hypothetical protein
MRPPSTTLFLGILLGAAAFAPRIASAQGPTCADFNTNPALGLAGNPTIIAHETTLVAAAGQNRAYCRADFTVSERGGPEAGYAVGEIQRIVLRVGLPLSVADGGTGGGPLGQGAWNGKVQNLGGGGLVGSVGNVTAATNAGYVGSSTDSGHPASENPGFGVIQATHELNFGKIEDFFSESLRLQYQWALRLAAAYYGQPAARNYWSGCSTGGRQGLVLAHKYGQDFDGFLIGAPHTNHVQNSTSGAFRQWANKDIAGGSVTTAKVTAAVNRMVAECDGQDGVIDGILNEPRACRASAALNVCGQPGAPTDETCLTPEEAQVIDIAMDGARNDLGHRVWFSTGRATSVGLDIPATGTAGNGVFGWAKKDMDFDWRTGPRSDWDDLHQLATTTVAQYINMGSPNLDLARDRGAKILMWHGLADNLIPFESNIYYYSKVLDNYGGADNVSPWFRFFLAPGVAHCGGGNGPQPQNLFETMVNWAENDAAPESLAATGGGRTRPLCQFPQTAIYDGVGDPNVAASFSCGGNIQTKEARCNGLIVRFQHETGSVYEPLGGEDDVSCGFAAVPVTRARFSPRAINGWYSDPAVTITATDPDDDLARTEYKLDYEDEWTTYTGRFRITRDGQHRLSFRSADRAEHVESAQVVAFANDATAPVISGLPAPSCTIRRADDSLVKIAAVGAHDGLSGIAEHSLSIRVISNEHLDRSDVVIKGGDVFVRAQRSGRGARTYTVVADVADVAGNPATATGTCTVQGRR